ncbi:MAG TPA: hypothetical protein VFS43_13970 [Polyangiaceae bacterium]|nr:hypothetical protein [Polyangiaceae bacterium]
MKGRGSPAAAPAAPDPRARLKAQREQQAADEDLRHWFNDWATTMRQVLPTRDRVKLGLVASPPSVFEPPALG